MVESNWNARAQCTIEEESNAKIPRKSQVLYKELFSSNPEMTSYADGQNWPQQLRKV